MEGALQVGVVSVESDVCEGLAVLEVGKNWKKFMDGLLATYSQVHVLAAACSCVQLHAAAIE